jgi:hypothetical protein
VFPRCPKNEQGRRKARPNAPDPIEEAIAGEMNPACGQFHHEEQIERDKSFLSPDFDGGEIHCCQHLPMRLQKRLPGCLLLAARGRLDAVFL